MNKKPQFRLEDAVKPAEGEAKVIRAVQFEPKKQMIKDRTFSFLFGCGKDYRDYKCDCNPECDCFAYTPPCNCEGYCGQHCEKHCQCVSLCTCNSECRCDGDNPYCRDQ